MITAVVFQMSLSKTLAQTHFVFASAGLCFSVSVYILRHGDSVDTTVEENSGQHLLPNPYALVPVSKGMRAVKLCTHKILQFLTGRAW